MKPTTYSSTIKSLLVLLLAALTLTFAPSVRAHEDKQSWDDAANIADTLHAQMEKVHAYKERFGAGPDLENEVQHLRAGIADLDDRIQSHRGEPKEAITKGHDLWNLMGTVQSEFRERARRENADIVVFHDEWRWK